MTAFNASWPSSTNVASAIGTLTMPSWITVSDLLTGLVADFERMTGYKPFLEEATASDTRFSNFLPSGREIAFPTGYTEVDEVYVNCTTDTDGTLLVEGTDFVLAPTEYAPIEGVTLYYPRRFSPFSLRVVGKRGFGTLIPPDAWDAVLWKAALPAFEVAAKAMGGTVTKVKQGPVAYDLGGGATMASATNGRWGSTGEIEAYWNAMVMKYQRVTL